MWSPLTARASCELTFVAGAVATAALVAGWRPRPLVAVPAVLVGAAGALGAHLAWARGGAIAGPAQDVATVIALVACFLAIGAVPGAVARRIAIGLTRAIARPAPEPAPTLARSRVVLGRRALLAAAPSALPLGSAGTGVASVLLANRRPSAPSAGSSSRPCRRSSRERAFCNFRICTSASSDRWATSSGSSSASSTTACAPTSWP